MTTTALVAPGAELHPVCNTAGDWMTEMLGLVLHVQAGDGFDGIYDTFNNPKAQASSTFWVGKDGRLVQWMTDVRIRAWAQSAGNFSYCSVETEGEPGEPLTDAQMATLAHLLAWGHSCPELAWHLQLAEKPGDLGFGYHAMGGQAWGGHLGCPSDVRIAERAHVLDLARAIVAGPAQPVPAPSGVTTITEDEVLILTIDDAPGGSFLLSGGRCVHIPNDDLAALAAKVPEVKVSNVFIKALTGGA